VTIHSDDRPVAGGDLSRLRIDRDVAPRRRWLPWVVLAVLAAVAAAVYPSAREYYDIQRAPEVEVARAIQIASARGGGAAPIPVLVATGYVVARRSSDVGVKAGGRLESLTFEEGTRVRGGQVIARIEHADLDAQLAAARAAVAEAEMQLAQATAAHEDDKRQLERQRALSRDGITTVAALTLAETTTAVSSARVRTGEAAIISANARVRVTEEALENTNVRAPFDGVVIRKRAEVGETVSPFGVAGQATREGGAIATIADLRELEVQAEVSETNVAKLRRAMPATVKLQAYPDAEFQGRVREIFPSADRAKAIVEVRVSILDASTDVKPEMTASVTFLEPPKVDQRSNTGAAASAPAAPTIVVSKRAIVDRDGRPTVWVVVDNVAAARAVALGPERLDQVEVNSGLAPGEAVILNPPYGLYVISRVLLRC
jgi:RND family efflux transporter MFP subunit